MADCFESPFLAFYGADFRPRFEAEGWRERLQIQNTIPKFMHLPGHTMLIVRQRITIAIEQGMTKMTVVICAGKLLMI